MNALVEAGPQQAPHVADDANPTQPEATIADEPNEPFPVEFALLGGGVVASLIGLIGFGIPSLLVAAYAVNFALKRRRAQERFRGGLLSISLSICMVGFAAGLWLSSVKWLHRPIAAPWQHAR